MKTIDISVRTCHIIINGADLPTIYWGEMKDSSETIEKVRLYSQSSGKVRKGKGQRAVIFQR